MLLNKKQKRYLFTEILSKEDLIKLFETTDLKWLLSRKVKISEIDTHGWKPLIVDGEKITDLNFSQYGERWNEVLNNIDEWEQCQWCNEWLPLEELIKKRKGFTILCPHCRDYLVSREGEC